jgi:hypothetical protein
MVVRKKVTGWKCEKRIHFFSLGGSGVLSNVFSASSNLTPLKFGIIASAGFFLCFARLGFDMIASYWGWPV